MSVFSELAAFCEAHSLGWDATVESRFTTYLDLLQEFRKKMNLIGPMSPEEIVRQLFIDSLAAAVAAPPSGRILDVGTGAGLPGIPLKLLAPDRPMTLVEPRKKRASFLRIAVTRLRLEDVEVLDKRIEMLELEPHDWVVSKAFRAPAEWVRIATPLTAPGGRVVCLHASDATADLRAAAAEHNLVEETHIADVARDLAAPVPARRSITVFVRDQDAVL